MGIRYSPANLAKLTRKSVIRPAEAMGFRRVGAEHNTEAFVHDTLQRTQPTVLVVNDSAEYGLDVLIATKGFDSTDDVVGTACSLQNDYSKADWDAHVVLKYDIQVMLMLPVAIVAGAVGAAVGVAVGDSVTATAAGAAAGITIGEVGMLGLTNVGEMIDGRRELSRLNREYGLITGSNALKYLNRQVTTSELNDYDNAVRLA